MNISELPPIDSEQNRELLSKWGIRLGKYTLQSDPNETYDSVPIPVSPHVFSTNKLYLESLRTEETVVLDDAMVMLGHGMLFGENREWRFIGTNKSATETVTTYDKVANNMGWPSIDAVLVCRGMDTARVKKSLEEERNSKAIFVRPSVPIIVSPVPRIYPGASGVNVGGFWEKEKGVSWIGVTALEWQGLDSWQQYWADHKEDRSRMEIPDWAKGKAR